MYKTSISVRMLFMTSVFAFGFLVFSVILVSRSLDMYFQNQVLREQLSQKETLVKQFSEQAETLNQYRLLEKELKKLVVHSSMPVVYAKNPESVSPAAGPNPAQSPSSPAQSPQPHLLHQPVDLSPDPVEVGQWEQEPDVPVDSGEENPETTPTGDPPQEATVDTAANETPPPEPQAAAASTPQPGPQAAAATAPQPDNPASETTTDIEPAQAAENKEKPAADPPAESTPAPKVETAAASVPSGPLVDVNSLSLTVESNNTVNFQYTLSNIHPDNKIVAGFIFIILANPYLNPPLFAPYPAVPLVGGFPADFRKGTQFSIKHGKSVRGKLPGLIDPGHYNQAWIFVYSKDGELILKKHLISNNG